MRIALVAIFTFSLTGCAVVSKEVARPEVAARYDSDKTTKVFAECAAEKFGKGVIRKADYYAIELFDGIRLRARWNFFPTLEGSQAELRGSPEFDAGSEIVRGCA